MRMWLCVVVLVLGPVLGFGVPGAWAQPAPAARLPPLADVVRQFQAMAMVVDAQADRRVFMRWSWPVRVGFRGSTYGKRSDVTRTMADVARLTGLSIDLAGRDETVNLAVWIQGAGCRTEYHPGYAIVGVSIRTLRPCLLQHMVQAVGPRLPACHARPSLFCPEDALFEDFQPVDRLILTAAFDPRLQSDMTEAEAMPLARTILADLHARWEKGERW